MLGPRLTQAFSAGMGLWAERPPLAADRTHLQKGLRCCCLEPSLTPSLPGAGPVAGSLGPWVELGGASGWEGVSALPPLYFYFFFVFLPFLGPLSRHMEVPRLGVKSEL